MRKSIPFFIIITLVFLALLFVEFNLQRKNPSLTRLDENWKYRWGDFPFDADGTPVWIEGADSSNWRSIAYPSNPPDRNDRNNVWFCKRLPNISLRDPQLFISSIDIAAEFYLDGSLIYSYGNIDEEGVAAFQGWTWHLVTLPEDFRNSELYIRVYSDYYDIGLWGDILIGEGDAQTKRIHNRDLLKIVVGIISFLLCFILTAVFIGNRNQKTYLFLSLIVLILGIRVIAQTYSSKFLLNAPLLWEYVRAVTYMLPVSLVLLFIIQIIGKGKKQLPSIVWKVNLGVAAGLLIGTLFTVIELMNVYTVYDVVFACFAVFTIWLLIKAIRRGNKDAQFILYNFIVMAILAFSSILVHRSVLPWVDDFDYIIMLQFSCGLTYVLVQRFMRIYSLLQEYTVELVNKGRDLRELNVNLERLVEERTKQLELANKRLMEEKTVLEIASITDGLTGLYNHTYITDRFKTAVREANRYNKQLTSIMFDLDHFKMLNDTYGHLIGDKVLKKVAQIIKKNIRNADAPGRYGGEEFLIILPETDLSEGYLVAERIRLGVEASDWPDKEIRLTISGGVAELIDSEDSYDFLRRVDVLLYQAKALGRNRVEQ